MPLRNLTSVIRGPQDFLVEEPAGTCKILKQFSSTVFRKDSEFRKGVDAVNHRMLVYTFHVCNWLRK